MIDTILLLVLTITFSILFFYWYATYSTKSGFALDENKNGASGCSIDTLQNTIQKIEKELSISLMNRLNVFCKIEDEILCVPSFKLSTVADKDTLFYDLTILKKRDLNTYLKPISEGWCAHLV